MDNFCYGPCDWEAYLWHWTDWFLRIDIVLLGLMSLYVLVIGSRGFLLTYLGRRKSSRFLSEAGIALRSGAFEDVIFIAGRHSRSPVAQMAAAGLSSSVLWLQSPASAEVAEISAGAFHRSRQEIIRAMSFGMNTLRAIGYTAPLVGSLGTLFGILDSFRGSGMEKHAYLAMTTSLVAYALIPTAAGLVVAAPAVAIYNLLQASLDKLNAELVAFGLDAISLLAGQTESSRSHKTEVVPDGYATRLTPKFPLQKPLSQSLAPALAAALGLVIVAWTPLANPYPAKGLDARLLRPGEAQDRSSNSNSLTIEVIEQSEMGSRIVYLNATKSRPDELFGPLRTASQQGKSSAYIRAEDNVPWADVANVIDAAEGLGYQVVLLPRSPETTSREAHKSAEVRK